MIFRFKRSYLFHLYTFFVIVFVGLCAWTISPYLIVLVCIPLCFFILHDKIFSMTRCDQHVWKINQGEEAWVLLPSSVIWRFLMILHFSRADNIKKKKNVVIFSDMLSKNDYCALRRSLYGI